jgi:hypothetical protein
VDRFRLDKVWRVRKLRRGKDREIPDVGDIEATFVKGRSLCVKEAILADPNELTK